MAYLHACANGNFTTAATWGVVDATSLLDSQASNGALTVAFTTSATFTPGAITIDGIAVKIATRATTPSGTMSVRLFNSTGAAVVAGTTVTINVSDIPDDLIAGSTSYRGCALGWYFFKFAAPVTLLAATLYAVQANTSVASQITLFNNGVANNHARMLRTTTTATPAAGDSMFIGGEWTAAGTFTARSVALDTTAATDYGGASTSLASLGVSKGGTLTRAASATQFRISGVVQFWQGSSHDLRATPSTSFRWEFDCAADGDFGIVSYEGLTFGGSDPWGTGITRTRLAANAAAAATSLTVADSTGWKNGNTIAISGTRRVNTEAEEKALNADAAGTTLAFAAGLATAHDGSASDKAQADIVNISRNCVMTVVTSTFTAYVNIVAGNSTCTWALFEYIGTTTAGKAGFDLDGAYTHTFTFCAFARSEGNLFVGVLLAGLTLNLTDCVTWDCATTGGGYIAQSVGVTTNTYTFTRCSFLMDGRASQNAFYTGNGSTVTMAGCRWSGIAAVGVRFDGPVELTVTDCEWMCNAVTSGNSLFINANNIGHRVARCLFWRNVAGPGVANSLDIEFEDCEFYGNTSVGLELDDSHVRLLNCIFASETGYAQTVGAAITGAENDAGDYEFQGCTFSPTTGIRVAQTVDLQFLTTNTRYRTTASGCTFGGATEITTATLASGSVLALERRDGTTTANSWRLYGYGQIDYETGTTGAASPAMKMTPESAKRIFESQRMAFPVANGKQITFTVAVRKNAAYNGTLAPRLVLKANGAVGISKDVVLDTLTVAADTWENLTGQSAAATEDGVLEVVVQCQGTAGAVFVDDFSAVST